MNKRLDYIDILKGLSILCITFLHFEAGVIPLWLNVWIGMFMVSAFYFTSGWVMGLKDDKMSVTVLLTYPLVWLFNNKARFMLGRR